MNPLDNVPLAKPETVALGPLLGRLRELIVQAHTQALRAVDAIQVQTCWENWPSYRRVQAARPGARNLWRACCRNWPSA